MVNYVKYLLWSLFFLVGMGEGVSAQIRQMMFEKIDTYNGLGDDRVYHILQASDGRMVFTTHDVVSVYDAVSFRNVPHSKVQGIELSAYNGAYHCYVGRDNLLWIKDNHNLRCLNVCTLSFVKDCGALLKKLTGCKDVVDVFCDRTGQIWCVTSDNRLVTEKGKSVPLPKDNGVLQDLIDDDSCVYLFYSNTSVVILDKETLKTVHSSYVFDDGRYSGTSLVVPAQNGKLYQLRNGIEGGICLCYDTRQRTWKTVFDVPYAVHTIVVSHDRAYVTTREEMWEIDTNTDETSIITRLMLGGTPILPKHMNTIFVDNQDGVWIGSYSNGLLYSHPSHVAQDSLKAIGLEDYSNKQRRVDYHLMPMLVGVRVSDSPEVDALLAKAMSSDTLCLDFSQKDAELTFSALNYPQPHHTKYLVRLLDVDTVWRNPEYYGGETNASGCLVLRNMPFASGTNTIEVRAMLGNNAYDYSLCVYVGGWADSRIPMTLIVVILLLHIAVCFWFLVVEETVKDEGPEVLSDMDSSGIAPESADAETDSEEDLSQASPFLDKVRELVIANLRTNGYNVEQLSEDLCMERTGLYKKLTALTGMSPSAYIRSIRLERAVALLREGKMNVQEIADEVGFNSASYMSRCFVQEYGCTPLEYVKQVNGN